MKRHRTDLWFGPERPLRPVSPPVLRYHESQLSEADWHLHSTHDPDEVQVDPRALSDVTDEEEVQVGSDFCLIKFTFFS